MTDKKKIKNNCTQLNTIIILLVAIFFSMVGMGIGYYMNRPSIPKYYFHPDYVRYIQPKPVLKIDQSNIEEIRKLPLEKQSFKLLKEGNYLINTLRGFHIKDRADTTLQIGKSDKWFVIPNPLFVIRTQEYIKKRKLLVQKIKTNQDLKSIKNSSQLFLNPEIVKIGFYVQENTDSRSKTIPYKIIKGNNPKKNKFVSVYNPEN